MSFRNEILLSLNSFNDFDKPKETRNKINFYADFIELFSLLSNADGVSFGDVQDRFFGTKDYKSPKERDDDSAWIQSIFNLLEERAILYDEDYPFNFDVENTIIYLKDNLNFKNKVYLALLIASSLFVFKDQNTNITDDFESISFYVLKEFLPSHASVREFGKNSNFSGNAREKIRSLGKEIGLNVEEYDISQISERNYQERGLDLIGWFPSSDSCMNKIIYLCQCACGKDTESKHHDTRRFENYFTYYRTSPQHCLFIPYSLQNTMENKFYNSDLIEKDFFIFERQRIICYFSNEQFFQDLDTSKIVNEAIDYKLDIV